MAARIGHLLRVARQERSIPQAEVARALRQTKSTISRMENGKTGIPPDLLSKWAAILGVSVEILFWRHVDDSKAGVTVSWGDLDGRRDHLVRQFAATLPLMPEPAVAALEYELKLWRDAYPSEE